MGLLLELCTYIAEFYCYNKQFTGIFVIVASILIMTFDIGLSNSLRGFLFFAQVLMVLCSIHFHACTSS